VENGYDASMIFNVFIIQLVGILTISLLVTFLVSENFINISVLKC
jgi:hypothetical protein